MTEGIDFVNPTPLYEQIIRDIKKRIARGELKPGDKLETQQDLARRYNVSLITVKNALSSLVKDRVLYTRGGVGTYVAEQVLEKAGKGKGVLIGLVLRDLNDPFFSLVVHSIERRVTELGYHLLLSSSSQSIDREETQIERYRDLGVQGLIIASLQHQYRATEHIERLHKEDFPYVMVSYVHDPAYWHVGCDHELGGYMATVHLIKTGYKSIAYAHAGRGNPLSEVRKNGYARALIEHDRPFAQDLVYYLEPEAPAANVGRFQLGYSFAARFAKLQRKPEAVFFYNDLIALGFAQGAVEKGIRIPDDLAVVGFDDILLSQYASVPLTTVHQPVVMIGNRAVDVIDDRIHGRDTENRPLFRPSLVIRESCGARKREKTTPGLAVEGMTPAV